MATIYAFKDVDGDYLFSEAEHPRAGDESISAYASYVDEVGGVQEFLDKHYNTVGWQLEMGVISSLPEHAAAVAAAFSNPAGSFEVTA